MHKTKKQLLGLAGLAIVAVMTAIAISLPAPDAAAADSSTTQIKVRVGEMATSVSFVTPQDGSRTVNPVVPVSVTYSEATKITYTLYLLDDNGAELSGKTYDLGTFTLDGSGEDKREFDLSTVNLATDNKFGYGHYKIKALATGNGLTADSVTRFRYSAMIVTNTGKTDASGDPIFEIEIAPDVDLVQMQAYDAVNGSKYIFTDANGANAPLHLDRSMIDPATGKITVTLPFAKFNAPSGRYTIHSVAYRYNEQDGKYEEIPPAHETTISYTKGGGSTTDPTDPEDPDTPDTPNTGAVLDDMNISRLDYLLTGLIAFGAVAGFAIYLIHRRDRR